MKESDLRHVTLQIQASGKLATVYTSLVLSCFVKFGFPNMDILFNKFSMYAVVIGFVLVMALKCRPSL